MSSHEVAQDYIHDSETSSVNDVKVGAEQIEVDIAKGARPQREPPSYVKSLNAEERKAAELALVRKIDLRLIPMIIIM